MSEFARLAVLIPCYNEEAADTACDALHIYASYRLYDSRGINVTDPAPLRTLVHTVYRGDSAPLSMRIEAPLTPGVYELRLSMVQEGVAWWADIGCPGSTVTLVVK
jgi:hypothetical protein